MGILAHEVEGAELGVLPQGLVKAERAFLDGAVVAGGRSAVSIAAETLRPFASGYVTLNSKNLAQLFGYATKYRDSSRSLPWSEAKGSE